MGKKLQNMNIKDNKERTAFDTGSQRDTQIGKPRPSLTPTSTIMKLQLHYGNGCFKYGERNWELGQPISQYIDSVERHWEWFKMGLTDEPHLISAMWNMVCMDMTLDLIKCGMLDEKLDDRPEHMKEDNPLGGMMLDLVTANMEVMKKKVEEREKEKSNE